MGYERVRSVAAPLCACALAALVCAAIAAAPRTSVADNASTWADDAGDCVVCHTRQADAADNKDALIAKHAMLDCVACHDDDATLSKMHKTAEEGQRIPKTLKQTSVPNEACLTCHQASSDGSASAGKAPATKSDVPAPSVPAIPAGVTIADANGLEVDVHALPENSDHATVTCGSCHTMHAAKSAEKTTAKVCGTCHHKNVFECHTCH